MATDLTPELRLINACIQRAIGHSDTAAEDTAVDWDVFGSEVVRHGIAPLVAAGLQSTSVDAPRKILAALKIGQVVAALRTRTLAEPSLALATSTLHKAGLQAVVLKGGALAYQAYPRPDYRTLVDIDLMVAPAELQDAEHALLRAGFERMDVELPDGHHHIPPFRAPNGHFAVELHDAVLPNSSPYDIDTTALIARAQVRTLGSVSARVLAPADGLMHVCVHLAYAHRYQWYPLRGLADILALTTAEPDLDWDAFTSYVRAAGTAGAVYWPLRLSRNWLAAPIPESVLRRLAPARIVRRLVEPIVLSPYILDGRAPNDRGAEVLYRAIVEASLYGGRSPSSQVRAAFRSLFPSPDGVGHLPADLTRSRLRYGAYLGRPRRLARGAHAFAHLLAQAHSRATSSSRGGTSKMIADPASPTVGTVEGEVIPSNEAVTLSVVIPALNEEDGIAAIIERIEAVRAPLARAGVGGLEIIVVDDGSHDRTPEIAASYPTVRLIQHPKNRGYGAAIKTGFNAAKGQLLAFTDADGTYPPERFPQLCSVALAHTADVVVGSRRSGERSEMPRMRRIGNFIWSNLVSVIGNHHVADPASGMRVLRASALPKLYPLPDGLNFTPVMSTRCVHEDLKVIEVPIPYKERVGRSKLSIVKDGSRFLKTILWTSLEYNPVRVLGLAGVTAVALAAAIGLGILSLRIQGVTQLREWGTFSVFAALVLGVSGVSIFSLGAMFNYLVSLFRREPVRQGLFGKPLFREPLDQHFGWIGVLSTLGGIGLALVSLMLTLSGVWNTARLSLWLLGSALLVLVGLQLVMSWIVMRVLETLSMRDALIAREMRPVAESVVATAALAGSSAAD